MGLLPGAGGGGHGPHCLPRRGRTVIRGGRGGGLHLEFVLLSWGQFLLHGLVYHRLGVRPLLGLAHLVGTIRTMFPAREFVKSGK